MRSNRPNYSSTPAGSSRALDQKPRPKRPKKEWNQLLLMLFFVFLPVLGLLAIFFQPIRWVFLILTVVCLGLMWFVHAFLFPGRMILTAVYGLLMVFTLVTALSESGSRRQINGPTGPFAGVTTTAAPTQIPQYIQPYDPSYGMVMDDTYTDGMAGVQEVGMSGGSVDESGQDLGVTDTGATGYVSDTKSGAEIALENFMDKWYKGIIADMVAHTPPSWREAQADSAQQQLFWKFAQKPLSDWRQMSAPSGTDASTARTITVEADINYGGELRTYKYDAIALFESEEWYIDPDSLSSGILQVASTPTPDPNVTPTPTPVPTPTPTPGPKTKLYYNKDGGKMYHADAYCPSVADKYLPLSGSFTYKDINKSPYTRLVPCEKCNAPHR
ncbi:MAG: US12 family protein [Clostridia bacterium]|nr:US12 family protein [Clostridia bacterium]